MGLNGSVLNRSTKTTVLFKALNGSQWVPIALNGSQYVSMDLNGTVQKEIQSMRFPGLT